MVIAKKRKKVAVKLTLKVVWTKRLKLRAEGNKLWAEGDKLWAEGDKFWAKGDKLRAEGAKFWAEGDKLRAEGAKFWAEGDKLRAEGAKFWAEGVLSTLGNVTMEWIYRSDKNDYACVVDGKQTFEPKRLKT